MTQCYQTLHSVRWDPIPHVTDQEERYVFFRFAGRYKTGAKITRNTHGEDNLYKLIWQIYCENPGCYDDTAS